MCTNSSGKKWRLMVMAFAIASGFYNGAVAADAPRLAELEHAFWGCDYVATTRGVHAAPVEMCSVVTEELKQKKFHGNFLEMLEWWRQEKRAGHASWSEVTDVSF